MGVQTWPATKQGIRVHFVAVEVTPSANNPPKNQ